MRICRIFRRTVLLGKVKQEPSRISSGTSRCVRMYKCSTVQVELRPSPNVHGHVYNELAVK